MNQFLRGVIRAVAGSFHLPRPILEIGSGCQYEGQADLIDLRQSVPGEEYIGLDFQPGPGVDCVADVEACRRRTPVSAPSSP